MAIDWQEVVLFIAERNGYTCEKVMRLACALGTLLLSGLTECPETLLKEDFPEEVIDHLITEKK